MHAHTHYLNYEYLCLFHYIYIYIYIPISIYLYPYIYIYIGISICYIFISISIYLPIYLSIYLSILWIVQTSRASNPQLPGGLVVREASELQSKEFEPCFELFSWVGQWWTNTNYRKMWQKSSKVVLLAWKKCLFNITMRNVGLARIGI